MNYKNFIQTLGFIPKENTSGIFQKKYNGYAIEIDFENSIFNFGKKIKGESKTTQNFSQAENWVVLECVDRLLEKGVISPEDAIAKLKKLINSNIVYQNNAELVSEMDKRLKLWAN